MLASELFIKYLLASIAVQYKKQGLERSVRMVNKSYDFVIIGGGLSGLVVASRLTENPNVSVLVLEEGGSGSNYSDIPLLAETLSMKPYAAVTKFYYSTPSNHCLNKTCELSVGRVLGGGTVHNNFKILRGSRLDYDGWATKTGDSGWSYIGILPYLKKFETAEPGLGSDEYRGRSGPVMVTEAKGPNYAFRELTEKWIEAAKILNYSTSGDYNGPTQAMFAPIQLDVGNGRRQSADSAYIQPFETKRPNLHILMFAVVTKILFEGKKATGVEYSRFKKTFRVSARKEVVLSAGALVSPKILMLSGVGPRDQLEQFKIKSVAELLGVGSNLQDHVKTTTMYDFKYRFPRDVSPSEENYCKYLEDGSGVFGACPSMALGIITTKGSKSPDDTKGMLYLTLDYCAHKWTKLAVRTVALNPKSRGSVKLRNSDPFADPIIDVNYFGDAEDKQNMLETLKVAIKLMATKPFKDIGTNLLGPVIQECSQFALGSDKYLNCRADKNGQTLNHYSCTCKMGKPSDPMAVVDSRLRVLGGITNLRVVDTSVMPSLPRGNNMAPTYAIAEKAADLIKHDWNI